MDMHIGNSQSIMMKKYRAIATLKNLNDVADRIEIDFTRLDSKTAGEVKDIIAKTLHSYISSIPEELSEEKKNYIEQLIKQSMTNRIDIDYAKLDKDDESLLLAYGLKVAIQRVLTERKAIIYRDMTLNANY